MGYIQGKDRKQIKLYGCLDDEISKDNPVRYIDGFVESLDMNRLGFTKAEPKNTGRPAYNPQEMLKLYIYGMENGIMSSRKLERETIRNIEIMWLMNELKPDDKTICNFRKDNASALRNMFMMFCRSLRDLDLIDGRIVAIDGTKIRANNSKRNNYSKKKLERHIKYIEEKIDGYLKELDRNDDADGVISSELEVLKGRKTKYTEYLNRIKSGEVTEVSATDPDSRLMAVGNNGVDVSYNVQSAVDGKNKLITGMDVTNKPNDQGQLFTVASQVKDNLELEEMTALADKGYYVTEDLANCEKNGIETIVSRSEERNTELYPKISFVYVKEEDCYICPIGKKLYKRTKNGIYDMYNSPKDCRDCPERHLCTKGKRREISRHPEQEAADRADERFKANMKLYHKRQELVEHPFGTIKRTMGIRQFLTRGITNVTGEVALIFTVYNLKRLMKLCTITEFTDGVQALKALYSICLYANIINALLINRIVNG